MKTKIILSGVVIAIILIFSCNNETKKVTKNTEQPSESVVETESYTCPMHPDVTSDKISQCPECGMDLEIETE